MRYMVTPQDVHGYEGISDCDIRTLEAAISDAKQLLTDEGWDRVYVWETTDGYTTGLAMNDRDGDADPDPVYTAQAAPQEATPVIEPTTSQMDGPQDDDTTPADAPFAPCHCENAGTGTCACPDCLATDDHPSGCECAECAPDLWPDPTLPPNRTADEPDAAFEAAVTAYQGKATDVTSRIEAYARASGQRYVAALQSVRDAFHARAAGQMNPELYRWCLANGRHFPVGPDRFGFTRCSYCGMLS